MLKKENRLQKNKQFNYIYKHGEAKHSQYLSLVYTKTKNTFKVGFSVSKKVGKSVVRNKVKRRLRECFKLYISSLDKHFNYVFIAKPTIVELDFEKLKKEVHYVLKKANKLNDNN